MPRRLLVPARRLGWWLFLLTAANVATVNATGEGSVRIAAPVEARPMVARLETAAWSPDDAAREGAGALEALLTGIRLIQRHPLAGLVVIGNHHGVLPPATERSLHRLAHMGLPIVRLARGGALPMPAGTNDALLAGHALTPEQAERVLIGCLAHLGAPPVAADPLHPTAAEVAAMRARLQRYQDALDAAALHAPGAPDTPRYVAH